MEKVYSATYSGVPVYEFVTSTGSVMRRKSDGWVNATHILKAANFPKAKRTRILEKDVQIGVHEKVQGGYGKYQGTWVPLERAVEVAREFEVYDHLRPLFDIESTNGANSPPPAPKHHHASKSNSVIASATSSMSENTRMASQRKSLPARRTASTPLPKPNSANPITAENVVQKKRGRPRRLNPPAPVKATASTPAVSNPNKGVYVGRRSLTSLSKFNDSTNDDILTSSPPDTSMNNTTYTNYSDHNANNNRSNIAGRLNVDEDENEEDEIEEFNVEDGISSDIDDSNTLNFMAATSSPSEFMSDSDLANALRSPNAKMHRSARESLEKVFSSHNSHNQLHDNITSDHKSSDSNNGNNREEKWLDLNAEYTSCLLEYFMQPDDGIQSAKLPDFLLHPPKGFNVDQIFDDEGHTAFHWACSMGNAQAAEALINLGANYRAVNNEGETALMRTVLFTNAFTKRTFPKLVELLSETLLNFDSHHKTVLHHIADASSSKARNLSAIYYMDTLLAKLSQIQPLERVEDFINLQDENGDTAIHICAKNFNRKSIKLLLDYKAKTNIRNNQGLIAADILLDNKNASPKIQERYESLRNQSLVNGNNHGSDADNHINNYSILPHISEAAIEATHKVSTFLVESLSELSNAFDNELQRKELDIEQVETLLRNVNEEIATSNLKINEFFGEEIKVGEINDKKNLISDQIKRLESLEKTKNSKLSKIIERSQSKDLKNIFNNIKQSSPAENPTPEQQIGDLIELSKLQLNRKRLVDEVVDLYSGSDGVNGKMTKYKKLISACSDVAYDQVTEKVGELLQEIEKEMED